MTIGEIKMKTKFNPNIPLLCALVVMLFWTIGMVMIVLNAIGATNIPLWLIVLQFVGPYIFSCILAIAIFYLFHK